MWLSVTEQAWLLWGRYAKQRALQRAEALKGNVRVVKQQPTPVLALLLQTLFSTQVSPPVPLPTPPLPWSHTPPGPYHTPGPSFPCHTFTPSSCHTSPPSPSFVTPPPSPSLVPPLPPPPPRAYSPPRGVGSSMLCLCWSYSCRPC